MIPFLTAYTSIILRRMRDLDEYTITSYSGIALCIIYGPIVLIFGNGIGFLSDFEIFDWLLLFVLGTVSIALNLCRIKAV